MFWFLIKVSMYLMAGYVCIMLLFYNWAPPSPVLTLPIVGNLLSLKKDTRSLFKDGRKRIGDMFSLHIGMTVVVVLNGYDLIKEALVEKADMISYRPMLFVDKATGVPLKDIAFASGGHWKEQRTVTVSNLKIIGMDKNILTEKILIEVTSFTTYLSTLKGKPTDIQDMVYVSVSNIFCAIVFARRFEYEDIDFQDLMETLRELIRKAQNARILNLFPWLEYIPGDLFKTEVFGSASKTMMEMLARATKANQRDDDDDVGSDFNSFIDTYLLELKKQGGARPSVDNESLYNIMLEFLEAETETISTTINWCILYMVVYPDVQKKVYQEIIDKVGTERPLNMQNKTQLTYLNAVIMETQRLASIAPLALTHRCSKAVTLGGYTIPNGTYILPNLDSVLHDTTTWGEDAMSFRPERFINDNGKLEIPEEFIPFGIGRRACLGEILAKMELFLFLASMIQKFKFLPANPRKLPTIDYVKGVIASPVSYQVKIKERIVK